MDAQISDMPRRFAREAARTVNTTAPNCAKAGPVCFPGDPQAMIYFTSAVQRSLHDLDDVAISGVSGAM